MKKQSVVEGHAMSKTVTSSHHGRAGEESWTGLSGPPVPMEWTAVVASVTIINLASWLKKEILNNNKKNNHLPSPLLTYNFLHAESTLTNQQSAHHLLMSTVFEAGMGTSPGQ